MGKGKSKYAEKLIIYARTDLGKNADIIMRKSGVLAILEEDPNHFNYMNPPWFVSHILWKYAVSNLDERKPPIE